MVDQKSTIAISIIIPCFNSGEFIKEAILSCYESSFKDFEIIVVNDGSTDRTTLEVLKEVAQWELVHVFDKRNGGASSARNLGVAQSKGEFLLFLDSDNRIGPSYLTKAYQVLQKDSQLGVVYCKPNFFGEKSGAINPRFEVYEFRIDQLLVGNYIDMCSLVRKSAFLNSGMFDENSELFFGEDGDLWVRICQKGWGFHFIDEVLFDYRIREESLMGQIDIEKRNRTLRYFGAKHGFLIHQRYRQYFRVVENFQKRPFSYFLRILYYKYILRRSLLD